MTPNAEIEARETFIATAGNVQAAAKAAGVTPHAVRVMAERDGLPDRVAEMRAKVSEVIGRDVGDEYADRLKKQGQLADGAGREYAESLKLAEAARVEYRTATNPDDQLRALAKLPDVKDQAALGNLARAFTADVLDTLGPLAMPKAEVAPVQVNVDARRIEILVEDISQPERQAQVVEILREVGAMEP